MSSNKASAVLLIEISGSLLQSRVRLIHKEEKPFVFINLLNIKMSDVTVSNDEGKLGLHVENSTWIHNNKGFMDIGNVVSVNIISSKLILNCDACPPMIISGMNLKENSSEYKLRNDIAHVDRLYYDIEQIDLTIVYIIETTLKIHTSFQQIIATETADIILINSRFYIENSISFHIGCHYKK